MKNKYLLICVVFLTGCSLLPEDLFSSEDNESIDVANQAVMQSPPNTVSYHDKPLTNNVNDYAQWLIQDLFSNIDFPQNNTVFMVADLAILDSDLNKTNLFGRQMSEAILHEVHQTGFSTLDIRTTGFVRMTEEGDLFSQSRDYEDLSLSLAATNVITGTLTRHRGGYLLNARAVDLNSKVLIASAQIFVPYDVVDSVLNENLEPPIKLNNISKDTQLVDSPRGIPLRKHVTRP
jgi:TolB-like protein